MFLDLSTILQIAGIVGTAVAVYVSLNVKIAITNLKVEVEQKIAEVKQNIGNLKQDIRYLCGKMDGMR